MSQRVVAAGAQKSSPLECRFTPAPTVNCSRKSCVAVRHGAQFSDSCSEGSKAAAFLFVASPTRSEALGPHGSSQCDQGATVQLTHDAVLCRCPLSSILSVSCGSSNICVTATNKLLWFVLPLPFILYKHYLPPTA